jgi:hypothetical protein
MAKITNSLFNDETAKDVVERLKSEIGSPYVSAYFSTLGGKNRTSILLAIGTEIKEKWQNGIFENSPYRRFHIDNDGTVENFTCSQLTKVRKFTTKSVDDLISRLNKI